MQSRKSKNKPGEALRLRLDRPNQSLHPTAAALRFSEYCVSQAAAAGEIVRYVAAC
jgi:hypothetical protein